MMTKKAKKENMQCYAKGRRKKPIMSVNGGGGNPIRNFRFFSFLKREKDAECSGTKCILLKNLVITFFYQKLMLFWII